MLIKNQFWAIKQCLKARPIAVALVVLLYIFLYLMQPLELIITQKLIRTVNLKQNIIDLIFVFLIVLSLANLQFTFSLPFIEFIENKVIASLQEKLFKAVDKCKLTDLDNHNFLTKLQRARQTTWYNLTNILNNNLHFLGDVIGFLGTALVISKISLIYLVLYIFVRLTENLNKKRYAKESFELKCNLDFEMRKKESLFNLSIDKKSTKEIRCYGNHEWIASKWEKYFAKIRKMDLDFNLKWFKFDFILDILSNIMEKIIMITLIYHVRNGLDVASFVVILQSKNLITEGVNNVATKIISIYKESNYIAELREIINNKPLDVKNFDIQKNNLDLEFKNVSFGYDNKNLINALNFKLNRGKIVALVGENGSGKSTFAKLALGLLKPNDGKIFSCENVGAAFQDFARFEFSVRNNVGFGAKDFLNDDNTIKTAMRQGMSIEILNNANLDSILGKNFDEDGMELSGGQWQRIAISRALMGHKNLIIFDEPSASLDPIAELKQFENIREFLCNKSAIIVSHRIGIARIADRILYMENGKILEDGTHDELMAHGQKYSRFYNAQAKWYKE